jgi:hypothetical protein
MGQMLVSWLMEMGDEPMSKECQRPSDDRIARCGSRAQSGLPVLEGRRCIVARLRHWPYRKEDSMQLRRGCNALEAGLLGSCVWSCAWRCRCSQAIVAQRASRCCALRAENSARILAAVVEETAHGTDYPSHRGCIRRPLPHVKCAV